MIIFLDWSASIFNIWVQQTKRIFWIWTVIERFHWWHRNKLSKKCQNYNNYFHVRFCLHPSVLCLHGVSWCGALPTEESLLQWKRQHLQQMGRVGDGSDHFFIHRWITGHNRKAPSNILPRSAWKQILGYGNRWSFLLLVWIMELNLFLRKYEEIKSLWNWQINHYECHFVYQVVYYQWKTLWLLTNRWWKTSTFQRKRSASHSKNHCIMYTLLPQQNDCWMIYILFYDSNNFFSIQFFLNSIFLKSFMIVKERSAQNRLYGQSFMYPWDNAGWNQSIWQKKIKCIEMEKKKNDRFEKEYDKCR